MKILYISSATFPSEKSRSLSIMRVCQALHDAGHEITLLGVAPDCKYEPEDPIAFYGLKGKFTVLTHKISNLYKSSLFRTFLIDEIVSGWRARKLIKELQPDIVYSRLTVGELAFVPSSIPVIYEMHSLGPLGQRLTQKWTFTLLTKLKNFRKFVVTTNVLADILRAKFPNVEVTVARLSADLPININKHNLDKFRATVLQGVNFTHHVGYTGYLDTRGLRGTDVIIKCAAKIPGAAFHIVGGEPDVVQYWREYSKQYNKNNNIFFYGYRNPNEMPLFLNCFDVTVAPLQYRPSVRAPIGENMSPLKLPQYMSYGKAIVASDIPAHRECLIDHETALLVEHDNIDEWVSAINALLHDTEKRKEMGQQAINAYYSGFTHEMRVKNILSGI